MDKIKLIIRKTDTVKNSIDQLKSGITPRYQKLCDRMKSQNSKAQELLCGILLRDYLNITQDNQLVIGEHGKPDLASNDMHFSLSHSKDYVVLAISPHPVGVDIEQVKKGNMKVARRAFPSSWVRNLEEMEEGTAAFIETFAYYWTLYEACIKQLGCGFSEDVSEATILMLADNSYTKSFDGYAVSVVSSDSFEIELLD